MDSQINLAVKMFNKPPFAEHASGDDARDL